MTERELKKLSRSDLLEMLIEQGRELDSVKQQLAEAQNELENRKILLDDAGSIAEASLSINGVFLAAQAAADEYLVNIKALNDREEAIIAAREKASREESQRLMNDTTKRCEDLVKKTREECAALEQESAEKCTKMEEDAKARAEGWWQEVHGRLVSLYENQTELRSLMTAYGLGPGAPAQGADKA